jgi:hypothetical protein
MHGEQMKSEWKGGRNDPAETTLSRSESALLLGAFLTLAASLMSFTTL